jgi:hypothetical protein
MAQTLPRGRPFDRYDTPSWSLTVVGLVFAITGIVYLLTHPPSPGVWVVELVLVSVPAAGIVYGGYWVATRQLRRIDQWSIVTRALVGGVVAGLLIAVYARAEQAGGTAVADAELLVLLGTATGTAISLFAATSNARRHLQSEPSPFDNQPLRSELSSFDDRQFQPVAPEPLSANARIAAELLADTRSWRVLRVLASTPRPLDVETIAERVAPVETTDIDHIVTDLVHVRLPKLEAKGLIRYEPDEGIVRPTERIDAVSNASVELDAVGRALSKPNP